MLTIVSNKTQVDWRVPPACAPSDFMLKDNVSTGPQGWDCLFITHAIVNVTGRNAAGTTPTLFYVAQFHMAGQTRLDFISVFYFRNAAVDGFSETKEAWAKGDWKGDNVSQERTAFVQTFLTKINGYRATARKEFRGN